MNFPNPFRSQSSWGRLVEASIDYAERLGDRQVGAEHLLLAVLDDPTGATRRAFAAAGADPTAVEDAIRWSHANALRAIGIEPVPEAALDVGGRPGKHRRSDFGESCRQVIGTAATRAKLAGVGSIDLHMLDAIGDLREGTAARALRELGLGPGALHAAVLDELAAASRAA
ncbi:MAG: Clp protease N-terminal domain-containing protein [Solirubrobacteraceae bacterium]|nr:Clp protease N-terminal domain-containing protein [Solirubrobacteraceae bacterium]